MSLLRHSAWSAAAAITLTGSRFVLAAILARRLAQTGYGQYAYGQFLVDLSFLLCSLGATGAVSRYAAEYRNDPALLAAFMRRWQPFALGLPVIAAAGVVLGVFLSDMSLRPLSVALLATWTLASGMWAMQTAALTGVQRFDLIFAANAIAAGVMVAGALFVPFSGADPAAAFGLMAFACSCGALVGWRVTLKHAKTPHGSLNESRWRQIRQYALNIWITALLWALVWSRGELPIVRAFLGDSGVAHYSAALTLLGGAIAGVSLGIGGVAPQLTRLWGEGKHAEALATARRVMDIQVLLCGGAALALICLSPEIVTLAFGPNYSDASVPLSLFGFAVLGMTTSLLNHVLQIATEARFNRNSTFLALVVLFGAAIALVPDFGIAGAAIARAGTLLLSAAITLGVCAKKWGAAVVGARNATAATFVCAAAAAAAHLQLFAALWPRMGLLVCSLSALSLMVRDESGNRVLFAISALLRPGTGTPSVASAGLESDDHR